MYTTHKQTSRQLHRTNPARAVVPYTAIPWLKNERPFLCSLPMISLPTMPPPPVCIYAAAMFLASGVLVGDVTHSQATVWSRSDQTSTMQVRSWRTDIHTHLRMHVRIHQQRERASRRTQNTPSVNLTTVWSQSEDRSCGVRVCSEDTIASRRAIGIVCTLRTNWVVLCTCLTFVCILLGLLLGFTKRFRAAAETQRTATCRCRTCNLSGLDRQGVDPG